jgi:hypothetical protein
MKAGFNQRPKPSFPKPPTLWAMANPILCRSDGTSESRERWRKQQGLALKATRKSKTLILPQGEIRTLTGGILLQVEVLDRKRTLVNDGVRVFIKIKALITTDKMEDLAKRIKGKDLVQEYSKLQEDYVKFWLRLRLPRALWQVTREIL